LTGELGGRLRQRDWLLRGPRSGQDGAGALQVVGDALHDQADAGVALVQGRQALHGPALVLRDVLGAGPIREPSAPPFSVALLAALRVAAPDAAGLAPGVVPVVVADGRRLAPAEQVVHHSAGEAVLAHVGLFDRVAALVHPRRRARLSEARRPGRRAAR